MIDTVTIDGSEIPNNYWGCIKPLMGLNLPKHGLFEFKDSRTFENLQVRHYNILFVIITVGGFRNPCRLTTWDGDKNRFLLGPFPGPNNQGENGTL